MEFDRQDLLEDVYKKLIKLRKDHSCLRNGEYETLLAEDGAYAEDRR